MWGAGVARLLIAVADFGVIHKAGTVGAFDGALDEEL
jgi:hypothetical protein